MALLLLLTIKHRRTSELWKLQKKDVFAWFSDLMAERTISWKPELGDYEKKEKGNC